MRRSISLCEPTTCLAGQASTWKFHHTPATTLPKGTRLRFDLGSKEGSMDWQLPGVDLKRSSNVIYLELEPDQVVAAKKVDHYGHVAYDFILPYEIKSAHTFTVVIGAYKGHSKADLLGENQAQKNTQRRRTFQLHIDTKGKTQFDEVEEFHMDVKGNVLEVIRVLTPAFVTRGKRFDITIRFEDEFGNLTGLAPEDTLIELTYQHLRENLNWKLFVPETGFITLPNLYFNEAGTYRIQLRNTKNNNVAFSPPIRCYNEESPQLEWGLLRGESEKHHVLDEPEATMRSFRDEACYNFYGFSPYSNEERLTADLWKTLSSQISEFNEEDRFTAFLGFQWQGVSTKEGLRLVVYGKEGKPLCRSDDIKTNSVKKLLKSLPAEDALCIPFSTMSREYSFDFNDWDSEFERVCEIYNEWGSSECSYQEGNLFPISSAPGKVNESVHGSLRAALDAGKRFGFIAGGRSRNGPFASYEGSKQVRYTPGLTAIIAKQHQRDQLFDALYNRHCYATTGERILLDFRICNFTMGSEISASEKPGLLINRHLHGFVAATSALSKVEIIRCGNVWKTLEIENDSPNLEIMVDDGECPSGSFLMRDERGFLYYYLRVIQKDGHVAWSSPIWIDFDKNQTQQLITKAGSRKPVPKRVKVAEAPLSPLINYQEEKVEKKPQSKAEKITPNQKESTAKLPPLPKPALSKPSIKAAATKLEAKSAIKPTTKPKAKFAAKPAVAKSATKSVVKAQKSHVTATKIPTKPTGKTAAKQPSSKAVKAAGKPDIKKPLSKTSAKPAAKKPVAKPAVKKPVIKAAAKKTAKTQTAKPLGKPAAKKATKAKTPPKVVSKPAAKKSSAKKTLAKAASSKKITPPVKKKK